MKLPMVQKVYIESKLVGENTYEFEVGETRSSRVFCSNCLSFYTAQKQYVDNNNGYGVWKTVSKPHCH